MYVQLNLSLMNHGYNDHPDITNIDLTRMYTYLLYCECTLM